ncbi:MAG TPA: amidohydrolase [Bacilli bacterium]
MLLIKNANLISMAKINFEVCDILVEAGKIKQVGKLEVIDFPEANVIDAKGQFVTPGLVDPHCHIGLFEEAIRGEGADGNEMTNPVTPELRAIDAIKPQDMAFDKALQAGVTTVCTGPGSANVIGGTFSIIKTKGKTIDDMVVKAESAMKMALGENPKRVYGGRNQSPETRMATAAIARESLIKAHDYKAKMDKYQKDLSEGKDVSKPEFNMKWDSLSRVFDGMPVKIHAHQQDDIVTAVRLIEEFNLNATIEHCTEGYLIADYLKTHNQKVILGPSFGTKSKYELRNMSLESAKILADAKVPFAIMTDHPVIHCANALTHASLFVREGLDELEGLKAVTIYAAELNNVSDRVGSIEEGKDADIVIWSGHPFHYMTQPLYVIVNGEVAYQK